MENKLCYAGIDPGKTGAICFLANDEIEILDFKDDKLLTTLKFYNAYYDLRVVLEKVWGRSPGVDPKTGKARQTGNTSGFNFGRNYGEWIGRLDALEIEYQLAAPVTWQKYIWGKKQPKDRKEGSRQEALNRFPGGKAYFKWKKDHNRSDAALCFKV